MSLYTQFNRPLKITTPLGPDALLLVKLQGAEAISELYRFEVEMLAPNYAAIDFSQLMAKEVKVTLTVPNAILPIGVNRYFHGVVMSLREGARDREFTTYHAEIVPKFWLWTKRIRTRVFQQMKVEDILSRTLEGLKVRFELSATYYPRDYCVQYRESDFDFASRLMEEEGIYYYFEHTADDVTMAVTDTPTGLPDIATPNLVLFDGAAGGLRKDAHVNQWAKTQRLQSEKYVLWDHHFQLTGKHLEAEENIQPKLPAGVAEHTLNPTELPLEVYDYPGGYAKRFDGIDPSGRDRSPQLAKVYEDNQRTAQVRIQQQATGCVRIDGESNHPLFASGHKFTLARHFNGDGEYLLTRVRHLAQLAEGYRSGEQAGDVAYENRFECLPAAAPYRPQRLTPAPAIAGFQTATVTGPENSEIYVDKYGRVKVQFHWDRQGKFNADSSCWLRVAQVWAGPRWGGFFWPRIGHEVVVAFEDGDPDRPLIVGSVYNDKNMPPLELPGAAKLGGVKSCIFQGDPLTNFNALVFHDAKGAEYVQVHSQTHAMDNSESDRLEYAPQAQYTFQGSLL